MRRNNNSSFIITIFVIVLFILTGCFIYLKIIQSPSNQAKNAVRTFYELEQDGAFSDSWEMFHPLMKQRFEKGHYLQDRAHVFFNHFGVNTFTFSIDEVEAIENWHMEESMEPIEQVYKVTVSVYYEGKYGNFTIVQDVFTTTVDGEWAVLWDYKKSEMTSEAK